MRATYHLLIIFLSCSCFIKVEAQKLNIGFVPIGKVEGKNFQILEDAILDFYQAKVITLSEHVVYDTGMLAKKTFGDKKMEMNQLNAKAVNSRLAELKNNDFDLIIGLTDSALTVESYISEKMIIRGFAEPDAHVATISTYKLKQESANEDEFTMNLTKVARHEVGHVLGLSHCGDSEHCLMLNGYKFENIILELCPICFEKIDKKYLKEGQH